MPILTTILARQVCKRRVCVTCLDYKIQIALLKDERDDEDEWNPSKAAGVCLMLLANCCENDIMQHVVPFIQKHILNVDWRYRDAAVMALGLYFIACVVGLVSRALIYFRPPCHFMGIHENLTLKI